MVVPCLILPLPSLRLMAASLHLGITLGWYQLLGRCQLLLPLQMPTSNNVLHKNDPNEAALTPCCLAINAVFILAESSN